MTDQVKLDRLKLITEVPGYNFLQAPVGQVEVAEPPKYILEARTKERLRELEIENVTLLKVLGK